VTGVAAHPILSGKATALRDSNPLAFDAQVLMATLLLGFPEKLPTKEETVEAMLLAAALQVNFQIEQGLDPLILEASSSGHTRNSATYRDRYLDPRAASIVRGVLGFGRNYTATLTSVRFQGRRKW
jgi:hypothetical protein